MARQPSPWSHYSRPGLVPHLAPLEQMARPSPWVVPLYLQPLESVWTQEPLSSGLEDYLSKDCQNIHSHLCETPSLCQSYSLKLELALRDYLPKSWPYKTKCNVCFIKMVKMK